jgi:DNA repair protein RadC
VKEALALIDVRLVDHLIVGAGRVLSMAEKGLL